MRKLFLGVGLFALSFFLSGCVVISSNKTQSVPKEHPMQVQMTSTIAEIDAVGNLVSQSARANIYRAIAQRPNLLPQERIHLVNAITTNLVSQSDIEDLLLILVNNTSKSPEAVVTPAVPVEG